VIKKIHVIITSMALLLGAPMLVLAQSQTSETEDSMVKLDDISCRKLLKMNDNDKRATMIFFHGYMSAQKDDLVVNTSALANISDQIIDECINNPDTQLLNLFQKHKS
jgi:hypothetical protein